MDTDNTDVTAAETAVSTASAHTTSRKSAPTLRVDLIPGAAIGRFARVDVAPQPVAPPDIPVRSPGLVEIALSDGTLVRIDAGIDPRALRRVLAALRG